MKEVIKPNAPEKLYVDAQDNFDDSMLYGFIAKGSDEDIEYIRKDAFIEKAKKWFEQQPETYDANGIKCLGMEDFEDFRNYMKGE